MPQRNSLISAGAVLDSTPAVPARRRGPSLSRRTGQAGTVVQHSKTWDATAPAYGKFWQDLPGSSQRKRRTISLGVCRTKSVARQRLREFLEREGVNSKEAFHENTAPAVTFRQQADWWVVSLQSRKRRPVKPATDVQVVKLVVASAVNEEGEQVYPRTWNHDFIQLPMVRKDKQYRPTVTDADLKAILSNTRKRKYVMLFSLLAATGLRIGEALALRSTDFGPDCRVLRVRRSVWRGTEQEPKTSNAVRIVDIPEGFASELRGYLVSVNGYLFATADGKPLQQRNVLRILRGVKSVGFHAFRRFRLTWLRKNSVPKDLERYWIGHAPEEVGDLYSKLKDDVSFRQEWAERAGLGFELVHVGTQYADGNKIVKVA
jgi:integrase